MLKGKCKKELMKIHPNKAITCTLQSHITAKSRLIKNSQNNESMSKYFFVDKIIDIKMEVRREYLEKIKKNILKHLEFWIIFSSL